jgi:hypothetical protein
MLLSMSTGCWILLIAVMFLAAFAGVATLDWFKGRRNVERKTSETLLALLY